MARKKSAPLHGANLGFEAELFETANGLRGNVDAAEYKHIVLGLIFLKYISDLFEEHFTKVEADGGDPEDRDEYTAHNVFWVPADARWTAIQANAKATDIGVRVDNSMAAIERENPSLQGVLPKEYGNPRLDPARLGKLIDTIATVGFSKDDAGSKDILGRVYEYFLQQFAGQEGKQAGEFYTPRCIVRLLVEMIEPYKGRIFDPCCGSGGMFVQSERFIEEHGGKLGDIAIYGQESNHTTWRLAKMNMAIRGIDADIKWNSQGSFIKDAFPDMKADFVLANPPFNDKTWGGEGLKEDKRWQYGVPPASNANYAWIQHFISHLSPTGIAAFVMANGSMSSSQSGEGEIRKALIEANVVDCVVALPSQLFYGTQIPVCVWILARDRTNGAFRDRRNEILFIDARKLGTMIDRTRKELFPNDIHRIASSYHAWRDEAQIFFDVAGFSRSTPIVDVRESRYVLNPGRHIVAATPAAEDEPNGQRLAHLGLTLQNLQTASRELDAAIDDALRGLSNA